MVVFRLCLVCLASVPDYLVSCPVCGEASFAPLPASRGVVLSAVRGAAPDREPSVGGTADGRAHDIEIATEPRRRRKR